MADHRGARKALWNEVVRKVIDEIAVPYCEQVAQRANALDGIAGVGYLAGTEGAGALDKRDYRATVITVSHEAARKNLKHNTLVRAMGEVGAK